MGCNSSASLALSKQGLFKVTRGGGLRGSLRVDVVERGTRGGSGLLAALKIAKLPNR